MAITLTATATNTLLSLQQVTSLFQNTSNELNTGKKVNSASDDATAYFQSASLYDRASTIQTYKTQTDQSINSLNAALTATSAVDVLLKQLQGVLQGAQGGSTQTLTAATKQIKDIGKQLYQLVKDATYNGLNLLAGTNAVLKTQFSERTAATFTVNAYNIIASAAGNSNHLFTGVQAYSANGVFVISSILGSAANTVGGYTGLSAVQATSLGATKTQAIFANALQTVANAITQNRAITASLGTNIAILQARSTFGTNYSTTLNAGGDKLTLADLNTVAAQSQALQLRQSVGIQVLSVANTQAQSILNLLR